MKVMFFFGSGADTDCNPALKSGASFTEALVTEKYSKEIQSLLGEEYKSYPFLYPQSTKFFIQTIYCNQEEAEKLFGDEVVKNIVDYKEQGKTDKEDLQNIIREYCKKWYEVLTKSDGNEENEKEKTFFLKYGVLFDALDEKFNALRTIMPSANSRRVICAYASVFVQMVKTLYDFTNSEMTFPIVFQKLNEPYKHIGTSESGNLSYYEMVHNRIDEKLETDITTTNYTTYAEMVTGVTPTYLHGKLTWFEDLKNLTVYDCTDSNDENKLAEAANNHNLIPFILIPSGVKPLICRRQIEQFAEFIRKLDGINVLIVTGYRFNSEDNHINSIIAEWLRKDKCHQMIYMNFENNVKLDNMQWIDKTIKEICIEENEPIQYIGDKDYSVIVINVNADNARKRFAEVLNILK